MNTYISYITFGTIFLLIGISLGAGISSYFDNYSNQDMNQTSHRVETDEFIFIGATGDELWLENNPDAGNTTLSELINFIKEDKTNERIYDDNLFMCGDYAEIIHNNAEAQGIRTGWVTVAFYNEDDGHAINVFDTDHGLIFYDGTNDDLGICNMEAFVDLRIGQQLFPVNGELLHDSIYHTISHTDGKDYICDYYFNSIDGRVSDYDIVW